MSLIQAALYPSRGTLRDRRQIRVTKPKLPKTSNLPLGSSSLRANDVDFDNVPRTTTQGRAAGVLTAWEIQLHCTNSGCNRQQNLQASWLSMNFPSILPLRHFPGTGVEYKPYCPHSKSPTQHQWAKFPPLQQILLNSIAAAVPSGVWFVFFKGRYARKEGIPPKENMTVCNIRF